MCCNGHNKKYDLGFDLSYLLAYSFASGYRMATFLGVWNFFYISVLIIKRATISLSALNFVVLLDETLKM